MDLAPYAPYFSIVTMAIGGAMTFTFWKVKQNQERARERHVRRAVDGHVRTFVQILENVYNRAEKADRGEREAKTACRYFEKSVYRIESLKANVENLLPELDQDTQYAKSVRVILGVGTWLVDTYHDPTLPEDRRVYLWKSEAAMLETRTRAAVKEAESLNIVKPVVID